MFRVKICGLRTRAEGAAVAAAGGDAIGLNFYARSPRFVDLPTAQAIAAALPAGVQKVGLFVDAPLAEVQHIAQSVPLDIIQLHGDEPPEFVAQLKGWPVLKAFRTDSEVIARVLRYVDQCQAYGAPLAGVLLDAYLPGSYGGTGHQADWSAACALRQALGTLPLILAGGLKPENVADAIAAVQPFGVDTASGVESSPGVKDADLVQAFVKNARAAGVEA